MVTKTLIGYIEGTDPAVAANQVFKMHITDELTGSYEFELLQAVKHENSELFGVIDDTENLANLPATFIVVAEIEDKDCDVLFSKVLVTIDDDMPVITECHDEQGNAINLLTNGSFSSWAPRTAARWTAAAGVCSRRSRVGRRAMPAIRARLRVQVDNAAGRPDPDPGASSMSNSTPTP